MIVTFCGHSRVENKETVREQLTQILCTFPADIPIQFYLGGYGEFDELAASVLYSLKNDRPYFETFLILPYPDRKTDTRFYDSTIYPPLENVPKRYAISKRNMWMIDMADYLIAYVVYPWGGAAKTMAYAERKNRKIISLGLL